MSDIVWDRFGNVPNYIEPFFGSGAVLLGRPHSAHTETVNDKDCLLANFWRALKHDPDAVAYHADWPVNEADQHARHLWLVHQADFREKMKTEPGFYDTKIAGWWVWGQCIWIGSGWCAQEIPCKQLPHLGNAGTGVHRKRPHLGNAGKGLNRLGVLDEAEEWVSDRTSATLSYMRNLAERMRSTRVCCGDWSRICGSSPTFKHGVTGVFLDPPYADEAGRKPDLYSTDSGTVAHDVREWAIENGSNQLLRIALCGYEGEHAMPESWSEVAWKARGGYGSQGNGAGRENSAKERIWFSPYCLKLPTLWDAE